MVRQCWGEFGMVAALFLLTGAVPARADPLKESIYVLGIHIGNANGVLFGLVNSYDTWTPAHPNAEPLLTRPIKWTKEPAEILDLKTDDLTQLDKDLPGLNFSEMKERFVRITQRLESDLGTTYPHKSAAIFRLGAQITRAQGVITLGLNVRPTAQEAWRASVIGTVEAAGNTIVQNYLEVDREPVRNLSEAAGRRKFNDMATAAEVATSVWQQELGAAPGWTFAPPILATRAAANAPATGDPLPPGILTPKKVVGKPKSPAAATPAPPKTPVKAVKAPLQPLAGGGWTIRGQDRQQRVGQMTLKAITDTRCEGFIDWSSEGGVSGREIVTATFDHASRRLVITGKRLENKKGNLGLGRYTASLSSDAARLTNGSWGGASTGTWSATR